MDKGCAGAFVPAVCVVVGEVVILLISLVLWAAGCDVLGVSLPQATIRKRSEKRKTRRISKCFFII